MTFEPQYKRAYLICETSSTIVGYNYDPTNGVLASFKHKHVAAGGFTGANTTAEIAVHPSANSSMVRIVEKTASQSSP